MRTICLASSSQATALTLEPISNALSNIFLFRIILRFDSQDNSVGMLITVTVETLGIWLPFGAKIILISRALKTNPWPKQTPIHFIPILSLGLSAQDMYNDL